MKRSFEVAFGVFWGILFGCLALILLPFIGCAALIAIGSSDHATDKPVASVPPVTREMTESKHEFPTTASPLPQPKTDSVPTTNTPATNPNATWHFIGAWSGIGSKKTETLYIPGNEWRIAWGTRPRRLGWDGNFIIYVYAANSSFPSYVAANVIGINQDASMMYGSGSYYLDITSDQAYNIWVHAKY